MSGGGRSAGLTHGVMRWLLLVLGLAALLAPGAPPAILGEGLLVRLESVAAGVPLSAAALLALAVVLYAALALPSPDGRATRWLALGFGLVLACKLLAWWLQPPLGLQASYWATAAPTGTPERSTDFPWLADATRIDPRLDLQGEAFPVHFFNDAARFNFGPEVTPGRDQLPFSVRWQGWLLAPSAGARHFVLESNGPALAWLDDAQLNTAADAAPIDLSAGLHSVRVEYARPEARVPLVRLSWQREPGGALEPLGAPDVRWQATSASPALSAGLGLVAALGLLAVLLAWCASELRNLWPWRAERDARPRALLGLVPLVLLGYGMALEWPSMGRATILSGLDDWLIYESSARDILLNGLLMDGGQGHAPPFYGQPLYPYVLALGHRLSGESLFGPLALQFAALGLVLVGTAVLARRMFGRWVAGLVALTGLAVLLQLEPEHFKIARQLFNENLYMPLVIASLIVLVSLARRDAPPRWWQSLLCGLLLGLTAISRSQFLLAVPLGVLIVWLAWRRRGGLRALAAAALIFAGVVVAIAPATARNLVVSGQFVAISSSGGASLLEFHRPPPGLVDPAALQQDALSNTLHLDQQTRMVLAFMRADPRGYLATLLPLGAHSIGLQGRNDPGIYWPLFVTVLLYLASFALRDTRRLHVWPIHAFVATHLLVLMLFEADTYGYRLVMPMYAPMVAVAAQVPLGAMRALTRSVRSGDVARASRVALAGWGLVLALALAWQMKGLVDLWPERESALHGLGGAAAHAALTSDGVGAGAIYVASVDGTPRRFGAGSLPGLRYPWLKWFDPVRSVPMPAPSTTAVYVLSEVVGHAPTGAMTDCLGPPDASGEVVLDGARARQQCAGSLASGTPLGLTFDGVARVDGVGAPQTAAAGEPVETRLVWEPVVAHPDPFQVSLQMDDPSAGDGTLWGNGTLELYPSSEWQPDEALVSRLPVATDPTALPQPYRLTLGFSPLKPNSPPATATWQGTRTDRVPVSTVALTPGSALIGEALPADMRPVEGPPFVGGGLELIGARPLPAEAPIGSPLRIGLLWRAVEDKPTAAQFKMRLVRGSGEVVQESVLPLLGGRVAPSTLHAGNVVRDEQKLVISPRAPSEALALELVAMDPASAEVDTPLRLGSIKLTGRAHVFDQSAGAAEAVFGDGMQLLSDQVEPGQVRARAAEKVTIKLRWRSGGELAQAYKVFVHVLDPGGQQVVAQHDAEPQDGRAPTTGWVDGEVIDDEYAITLPAGLAAGDYPLEVGVYDPRSGDRLRLANGDNRLLLATRLRVR